VAELRREPIARRWVVIVTENPKAPGDYFPSRIPDQGKEPDGPCPFCAGHEEMTPPETYSWGVGKTGWSVRVVPNKFPFFHIEGEFDRRAEGMYDRMEAVGCHEIVVEAPDHLQNLATLPADHIQQVLFAYRRRFLDLKKDPRFQYLLILKNYPGVFNRHPHSHLLGMPVVPRRIDEEISGILEYGQRKERCIYCDIIREERSAKERVIAETPHFLVFCPFASRYPFETWIVPKAHAPDFHSITEEMIGDLARAFKTFFVSLHTVLPDPAYSLVFHTSPIQSRFHREEYHWHIETRLRIGLMEGFEWAAGFFVNHTPPENAAAILREATHKR
jgi:UDPglucose--hexose-1-phosphate uridylyltransferase